MWIRWQLPDRPDTEWERVPIRSVSVRAAFALMSIPPPTGSRGLFEIRSTLGEVQRRGICRVVFVREGVGAGLELRRGVSPREANPSTADDPRFQPPPPSSSFGRRSSAPAGARSDPPLSGSRGAFEDTDDDDDDDDAFRRALRTG